MGRKIVVLMEYNGNLIMNLDKLEIFKNSLKDFEKDGKELKIVFYGDYSDGELSVNMGYFNKFVNSKVCDFAISFKTKNIVVETGIKNRAIGKEIADVTENNIKEQVKKLYENEDIEVIVKSNKHWESILVDMKNAN